MPLRPHKAYFLVKINKEEQKNRREKTNSGIYLAPNYVWMTRCMQNAEIVAIGEFAHKSFPEAKIGDTLLMHHFIEGGDEDQGDNFLVDSDEKFNYYVCAGYCLPGERVLTYGIWTGEKLISHPAWVFLETEPAPLELSLQEVINEKTELNAGGIVVFKNWKETREDKENKMAALKDQITVLAKWPQNKEVVYGYQQEINRLSKELNTWYQTAYTVAGTISSTFESSYPIYPTNIIFLRSLVAQTKIEFMNKEYRVAPSEEIAAIHISN